MNNETRWQLIWRHVEKFIRSTAASWPTYAAMVREEHERIVPEASSLIEWSSHRDTHERMKLDAQIVRRFAHDYPGSTNHINIPTEVEEAMVFALGRLDYRDYQMMLTELAERYGMLPVFIPLTQDRGEGLHHAAAVMRETADAIDAMTTLTGDDGVIDANDKAVDLRKAQIELRQAMGALAAADHKVTQALHEKGFKLPAPVRVVQ